MVKLGSGLTPKNIKLKTVFQFFHGFFPSVHYIFDKQQFLIQSAGRLMHVVYQMYAKALFALNFVAYGIARSST
jgi:hypothetical protein